MNATLNRPFNPIIDTLMNYQQTAEYLGISQSQVMNLRRQSEYGIAKGKGIPFIRIGSSVRFRKEELDAWLDIVNKR